MTKFERAKRQTLKRWESIIEAHISGKKGIPLSCGFCTEYADSWVGYICKNCPIYRIHRKPCYHTRWYGKSIDAYLDNLSSDTGLILALTIYGWVADLHDPDEEEL